MRGAWSGARKRATEGGLVGTRSFDRTEARKAVRSGPGADWLYTSCDDLPQCSGGTLTCDPVTARSTRASAACLGWTRRRAHGFTREPFDASRGTGRYHFEYVFLPFGELGDPHGSYSLTNFEILPDGRASMFYDHCSFDVPITIAYEWLPSDEEGWLNLYPGMGETLLRYMALVDVESLRVQLMEPCRELQFAMAGRPQSFIVVRPGASCWVDRCTTPDMMQVDYCEGEEPPPCG
jgi:hypothetical protein